MSASATQGGRNQYGKRFAILNTENVKI